MDKRIRNCQLSQDAFKANNLNNINLQLQIHKIIWDPNKKKEPTILHHNIDLFTISKRKLDAFGVSYLNEIFPTRT